MVEGPTAVGIMVEGPIAVRTMVKLEGLMEGSTAVGITVKRVATVKIWWRDLQQ